LISIIICSRKKSLSAELTLNIEETIGIAYETITIDNSENKYSIFEAYNIGVEKSRYPYLCFMHDDLTLYTKNWGIKVIDHFNNEQTGAIGIAGSPYAPKMPGSWWGSGLVYQYILRVHEKEPSITTVSGIPATRQEVVTLDGVWLCIRRSLFSQIKFDSNRYKGFHFYDVDISMQINQLGFKLYCIFDILIRHYSTGNLGGGWNENAMIFNKKWISVLPVSCIPLTYSQKNDAELKTLKEYTYNLFYTSHSHKAAYKFAVLKLLKFPSGYLYHKTPVHIVKYCIKYFLKPGTRAKKQ
jgi:hypothetical protein